MAGIPRGVLWWIPVMGLVVSATCLTAGFAWSIERATERYANAALEEAGIAADVAAVANVDYRTVVVNGCDEDAPEYARAIGVVEDARLVRRVMTALPLCALRPSDTDPSPGFTPAETPHLELSPSPSPHPSSSPTQDVVDADLVVQELRDAIAAVRPIRFAIDSAALNATGTSQVELLATAINDARADVPGLTVRVVGRADAVGATAYNQVLSEARANAVREALIVGGVEAAAVEAVGIGEMGATGGHQAAERVATIVVVALDG